MPHFGEETSSNLCIFTSCITQRTRHRSDRQISYTHTHPHTHAHAQTSMWTRRCDGVTESRGTHRYRSYANRPVIIMKHKKEKSCILILHTRDEQRIWSMKCMIISVLTGATGTVTRIVKKLLEAILGYLINSLVHEKYRREKACDKRKHTANNDNYYYKYYYVFSWHRHYYYYCYFPRGHRLFESYVKPGRKACCFQWRRGISRR